MNLGSHAVYAADQVYAANHDTEQIAIAADVMHDYRQ